MATLNPQSLVTLWQIEQYGSFSATAKATGWSQPAISQQIKSWRHSAVRLWCNAPRMVWNSPPPVRCSPATARPSPIGWSGRPVKSRIIGIIGLLTCIWWPHRQSALLSRARTVVKLSMFTDIELSLIQMEPPEAIGLISQGKADAAAVFRYSSILNFLHIGDDLTFQSLGYDPMRLLVRRSSDIAKRFEETGEPVSLSAAKDEH